MVSAEHSLIARYFAPLAAEPGALGLRDDAAIIKLTGDDIVVTTDAIVAGVHFLPDDPAGTLARKALRVNLSDLAAKGAEPAGFVLTLALPSADDAFLAPFSGALADDIRTFGCPLLGGDTVSTQGPLVISVTAFGRVLPGRMVQRQGAEPGDRVMVTGTIGDAALGLDVLRGADWAATLDEEARARLIDRYRVPQPRSVLARAVREHASAAMDVSDGLAGDLARLCAVSEVSAVIDAAAIPLSRPARRLLGQGAATLERLIGGGDDYEILCTVPQTRCASFAAAAKAAGVAVSDIGEVTPGDGTPRFLDMAGRPMSLSRLSYSHF